MSDHRGYEEREVRVQDPSLSDEANRRLTEEARAMAGGERVEVSRDTPHHEREPHAKHGSTWAAITSNTLLLSAIAIAGVIVVVIMALNATASPVLVVVAFIGLLAGAGLVVRMVGRMTNAGEAASPTTAARLEDEGVGDPDFLVSEVTDQYRKDRRPQE